MNKIDKFLIKLLPKERNEILNVLSVIMSGSFEGMDIKKLKGEKDIYRVRKGRIRIIFQTNNSEMRILSVEFKSDNTYR